MAFISSHWYPLNAGHVIVSTIGHFENLYDLPDDVGAAAFTLARRVAVAMKQCYAADGISLRQHNEPAGHQDVWHFHLHVFPRYTDDGLYAATHDRRVTTADEREPFAKRLRGALMQ